ncbi:MAG: hypothetical protein SCH71_03325 [Desulfobulbaceae bacterium]|nr:hypothetical protein [Desulfobulbaceae bacterium]
MLKRYLQTGSGFFLVFLIYFLALLPILVIRKDLEDNQLVVAAVIWGVLAGLSFIPAAAMVIRRVWFFRGSGEPAVQDFLQSLLLEINSMDAPVQVKRQRKRFIVTWRLSDQAWCERLEKTRMKRVYELWLVFDNSIKTVTMIDKYRSVNWDLSPISVKTGWLALSRPFFKVTHGNEWGVENYEDAIPEDFRFTPDEIKSPVMNTILKNGGNVRFSLF